MLHTQVKSLFSSKLTATGIVVLVPVPDNTCKAKILVTGGKAKYDATKKALVWKVRAGTSAWVAWDAWGAWHA